MIAKNFSQAATTYEKHAFVQREVGARLLERLDYTRLAPKIICDLGSGTGLCCAPLQARYPNAGLLATDISLEMLKQGSPTPNQLSICNDAHHLCLKNNSIDLFFSNLAIQWCTNLREVFKQIFNASQPGGLFLFSTLGPDTLKEFRACWESVDLTPHTNEFIDMHDIGDALLHLGFQDPVLETEVLTIEYKSVQTLMRDLKGIGANNNHPQRARGLTGKKQFQAFLDAYEEDRGPNGLLPVTYEVIYGLAWIPDQKPMINPQISLHALTK